MFIAVVLGRRRWVSHHDGAFGGIAHVTGGELLEFGTGHRRGYGRWVRDVLVWTPGPLCLRNLIVGVDRVESTRQATGKVRRLGENPQVITVIAAGTVRAQDTALVTAPFTGSGDGRTSTGWRMSRTSSPTSTSRSPTCRTV